MSKNGSTGEPLPNRFLVEAESAGTRIDVFLRDRLPGTSRAIIRDEISAGRVLVHGRSVSKSRVVREGEEIDLTSFRDRRGEAILPDPEGELRVIHEDARFVVVEKEAGLPTLPKDAEDRNALACRLASRYPETVGVSRPLEAGLVHRLDTETSGLLVAARDVETWQAFRAEWKFRRVQKEYLALVRGEVRKSFTILHPIAHHPRSARRMIISPEGKSAESRVLAMRPGRKWSLVSVSLREGRRHQIRVHLAEAEHPVAGDPIYGEGPEKDRVPRLMLHASWLKFRTDVGARPTGFVSAPPADLTGMIRKRLGDAGIEAMEHYLEGLPRRR